MKEYPLIKEAENSSALKGMSEKKINLLCAEIRDFLCESVIRTGGHLSSNLGAIELTVAIHRAFDLPKDHLIFDVGHQSYTHKILTGRANGFHSLRKRGGMSGFTKRSESEYDCFGAGHSSTSVSAAIGFAEADKAKGSDAYTVAILGDGAFTGGMVHEALNNCRRDLRLIIILNENDMSISKNTGAFAGLIARIRASKKYYRTKHVTARIIKMIPFVGNGLFKAIRTVKQHLKDRIFKSNYFEDLGLYYLGPVDGHDTVKLGRLLEEAKKAEQSTVIHVRTIKGKGYAPAEKDPATYHGVSPRGIKKCENFSSEAGKILCDLAKKDERICAVTASMAVGTGLDLFKKEYPNRFYDVGIAEEHALTFSAGLAANGLKPYFAVYSSFLQRGYDNLIHDIALQNLPVTVLVDRAGISEYDGPTHHGIFDVPFLCQIPNMTVYAPSDFSSLKEVMELSQTNDGPVAIRYANSPDLPLIRSRFKRIAPFVYSDFTVIPDYLIITYGRIVSEAILACDTMKEAGFSCGIILIERLKPTVDIEQILKRYECTDTRIVFLEEGIKNGGAGMILKEKITCNMTVLAIDDVFDTPSASGNVFTDFGIGAFDVIKAFNIASRTENRQNCSDLTVKM